MSAKEVRLELRLDKDMHREWKKQAAKAGIPLAQWIRFRCEGVILLHPDQTRAA